MISTLSAAAATALTAINWAQVALVIGHLVSGSAALFL